MARKRRGRPLNGILVLDKPAGVSSNHALQSAKRLFFAAKAGHTGSLDPLATGVLPLCFGEATKFSQYLLDADKAYESTIVLGCSTDTGDAEGEVLAERDASSVTEADVDVPGDDAAVIHKVDQVIVPPDVFAVADPQQVEVAGLQLPQSMGSC